MEPVLPEPWSRSTSQPPSLQVAGAKETSMKPYEPLERRQRWPLALVAAVAALAVVSAALLPFAVDGRTPYFEADAASRTAVDRCRDLPLRAERHACLRAAAADMTGDTVVAQVATRR